MKVSVLFNEPKLLKFVDVEIWQTDVGLVSVLFNEPKLLKYVEFHFRLRSTKRFSALQRAEIAEIAASRAETRSPPRSFSALQRAEIAEIDWVERCVLYRTGFSALQRAEIAEIDDRFPHRQHADGFSALQRAEIAEIPKKTRCVCWKRAFQCSSTSRNC